jgi:hypothetical protein
MPLLKHLTMFSPSTKYLSIQSIVGCGRLAQMNKNVAKDANCHDGLKTWPQITPEISGCL